MPHVMGVTLCLSRHFQHISIALHLCHRGEAPDTVSSQVRSSRQRTKVAWQARGVEQIPNRSRLSKWPGLLSPQMKQLPLYSFAQVGGAKMRAIQFFSNAV